MNTKLQIYKFIANNYSLICKQTKTVSHEHKQYLIKSTVHGHEYHLTKAFLLM